MPVISPSAFAPPVSAVLREQVRRLERANSVRQVGKAAVPTGLPAIDALLPEGGLLTGALHEIEAGAAPSGRVAAHDGAARGFAAHLMGRFAARTPGTLRDNLTVSSGPLPEARLWELLEQVSLSDWVASLPLGLDTTVDEGSTILSGGQRQRLLLARAIAGNPVVLFLDEATSALDNITQASVTATIASLGMTRVVIAHRLSTVQDVDRIAVLDQGRIVESGTYTDLISAGGIFAELVRRQEL